MWRNLRKPVLTISILSPRVFTVSKTLGPSCRIGASTSMRWPERWETSLSAPLFEQTNPQRPAARLVAVPEIGFFLAVTLTRAFTDTFAGIRPADVAGFIVAQLLGAFATVLFR